ncbi:MAG: SGNH/GDSL hydrolase family protein [Candidatus Omnitrophica bacterium]|nr:SGNH/GDSL hydrolase family protein [Candidatus Omnitrophota bacterium]
MSSSSGGILKNCFLAIIGVISALLIMEAGVRIRQYVKYGTAASYAGGHMEKDPGSGLNIPSPGTETRSLKINSRSFRGPEPEDPKPADRIRIAFLGSSTTFCAEVNGEEKTWPYLVWRDLQNAYPGIKMDYVNASVPGYLVWKDVINLERRVKPLRPDIIIIYEGPNDLSWWANALAGKQGKEIYKNGWLEKYSLAYDIIKKNFVIFITQQKAKSERERLKFKPGELSVNFRKELAGLIDAAKRTAPVVVIATISYKMRREQTDDEKLRNANTALFYMPSMGLSGLLDAHEEYNRVIRETAKEKGVILVDKELMIPGEDAYFEDSIHFSAKGCELMAKRVVDSLSGSAEFKDFLRSRGQKQINS